VTNPNSVQILGQLGDFRFRQNEPPEGRKEKLSAVVGDDAGADPSSRATALAAIWRPHQRSFLDSLIHRPTEAARLLARRPLPSLVGHALNGLGDEGRQAFIKSGVISWRDQQGLHLAGGAGDYLRACGGGSDREETGGPVQLTPLHLLLLQAEVASLLGEGDQLEATARDVVAATFVSCLSDVSLPLAVEAFFVEWESHQQPSQATARSVATTTGEPSPEEAAEGDEQWMDCIITHDDLRPEAFVVRTHDEQRQILRDMFGDDWDEEDEAALEAA
jgi:hypothetical protein|tara:strand:+ start:473 stop:1300 length:828 start_codon:yes stop_codon:yes gene_type:complete